MALPERYHGRPILIIVENYVLSAIGELDADKQQAMAGVVRHTWGGDDDWLGTVREQLRWERSIDETIRRNWRDYQDAARAQGVSGSAAEFALMFADAIEAQTREA
jgi:hypothetical protein